MEPEFVELRSSNRQGINHHHAACASENRPMVMVKLGRKYATLEWDCVTLRSDTEVHVQSTRGRLLVRGMYDRFCSITKSDPGKPRFYGNAFYGTASRLLPETARLLAKEYFQLLRPSGPIGTSATI